MKRRTALKGVLGVTGVTVASVYGYQYYDGLTLPQRGLLMAHYDLIAELVDVVIPPTGTDGAKGAGVHDFVIDYLEDCATDKDYENFLSGLNEIEERSVNKIGKSYKDCSGNEKMDLLKGFESRFAPNHFLSKVRRKLKGRTFLSQLKKLTVEGYCSSKIGAVTHLAYVPIPGRYNGITQLTPGQKAWATQ